MKKIYAIGGSLLFLAGCFQNDDDGIGKVYHHNSHVISLNEDGRLIDARDGNEYRIVKIGNDYWFAENLRYVDKGIKDSTWCYDDKSSNCQKLGRLYSWKTLQKDICPEHWKVPSIDDWNTLIRSVYSQTHALEEVGTSLKSTSGWKEVEGVALGTNRIGFNAYPGGRRNAEGDGFLPMDTYAFFWSTTAIEKDIAKAMALNADRNAFEAGEFYMDHGMSVRCMIPGSDVAKINGDIDSSYIDDIQHPYGSMEIDGESYKTITIKGVEWMAENVNNSTGTNWCYGDDEKNCKKYGLLYDYETAKSICPEGWSLPSFNDFSNLGNLLSARELRSRGEWKDNEATNLWGISILPAGAYDTIDGFFDKNLTAYFWVDSDTKNNGVQLRYSGENAFASSNEFKTTSGRSVRCIKK